MKLGRAISIYTRVFQGVDIGNDLHSVHKRGAAMHNPCDGPLGAGTLTNILGNHYDPGPESSEKNGWGQWHRADPTGIGMDRTVATGTGFIGQYPPEVQTLYESQAKCPDNLLLFFHHLPYTYVLYSGKTVIQHIYDSHCDGAVRARDFVSRWNVLEGHIDPERYRDILTRLQYQAGEAVVWRDTICDWIYRLSAIADVNGRVALPALSKVSHQPSLIFGTPQLAHLNQFR